MSTDPFDGVGKLTHEVGQSTYIELIYTKRRTGKTIKPTIPNISRSLASLAFGKRPPLGSNDPAYPHSATVAPQRIRSNSYSLLAQKASQQPIVSDLGDLIRNSFIPQEVACAITTTRGAECPSYGCKIDLVFVLNATLSMKPMLDGLKNDIWKIVDQLNSISGNSRMSLVTFRDDVTVHTPLDLGCIENTNIALATFTAALGSVMASGPSGPNNSDGGLETAIAGDAGLWRQDAFKIVILITDSLPGGDQGIFDYRAQTRVNELAAQAGSCGINIVAINVGTGVTNSTIQNIMENYATQSGGKYIELPDSLNIPAFIHPFLHDLCQPINDEITNSAINGSFDTSINGWQVYDTNQVGSASWASIGSNGYMVLTSGGVEQTVMNLTPGKRIKLKVKIAGVSGTGDVFVALDDSSGTQPVSGGLNISNAVTIERSAIVSSTGSATISIENRTSPSITPIHIDDIWLYEMESEACGFGTQNLVANSSFETGVEGWIDDNDDPLTSASWNSSLQALIVEGSAATAIDNLASGQHLVLSFKVYENLPTSNDNLLFEWSVSDVNELLIRSGSLISNATTYPTQIDAAFTLPADFEGPLYINFSSGGTAQVKDVYCCSSTGSGDAGMLKLSFDQFASSRGGWAGGTFNNGTITLAAPGGGNDVLQQTYFELVPKATLNLSVNCIAEGGIIVEIYYNNNSVVEQFFSTTIPGIKSFVSLIPENADRATVRIKSRNSTMVVDDILVCQGGQTGNDGSITNLRTLIKWNGIPRTPTNIFNIVARITYRNPTNPFDLTITDLIPLNDGRLGLVSPTGCSGPGTSDFWKQQGNGGVAQSSITSVGLLEATLGTIKAGDIVDISARKNWMWSIPAHPDGIVQDGLVTLWADPPVGLIESIQFLVLANNVSPNETTVPVCAGPFINDDPAESFDFVIRYRNAQNQEREFTTTIELSALHQVTADFPTSPWDAVTAIGNGINGGSAKWEEANFTLDAVDGYGLDQHTTPIFFNAVGQGKLALSGFAMRSVGKSSTGCDSLVTIEKINAGVAINEIQSIILPICSGGRWALTFSFNGDSSVSIPWDADAAQVRNYLGTMSNIGSVENVLVTGAGTISNPFLITFTRELSGQDVPLLVADGASLTGTGTALVTRVRSGTENERQTVTKSSSTSTSLVVRFANVNSIPIAFNATLNQFQSTLEAMTSIGAGNVAVTGNIGDRDVAYQGPWYVTFQGTLASQNVPNMTAQTNGYTITTDWQGGTGANEIQEIMVIANAGTYALSIPNPNPTGGYVITSPIAWNASAAQVSAAITEAAAWLIDNIRVKKLPHDPAEPAMVLWTVEFRGAYASTAMDLITAIGTQLDSAKIIVAENTKGGGTPERQRVQIIDSNFGFYQLTMTLFGVNYTTQPIRWDSSIDEVATIINNLQPFTGDAVVAECSSTDPKVVSCYLISFPTRFGAVPLMTSTDELSCSPLIYGGASSPPYLYDIPECVDDLTDLCTPGELLCKPGAGDLVDDLVACCEPERIPDPANVYSELILQRDLFSPQARTTPMGGMMTIGNLATSKGLKRSLYNAYLRNFETGLLTAVEFSTQVETKMSIVLIEKMEDTVPTRQRIMRQLQTSKHILPSRMTWSNIKS